MTDHDLRPKDHADTIRRALKWARDSGLSVNGNEALAALEAYEVERQQAIDERDAALEWNIQLNAMPSIMDAKDLAVLRVQLQQAIDALREAEELLRHHAADSPRTHALTAHEKVRAALVSLGEGAK